MTLPPCPHRDCINADIANAAEIWLVVSDPANGAAEIRRLRELITERRRLIDERDRISAAEANPQSEGA